jgi:CheY-like chemotaxis protein
MRHSKFESIHSDSNRTNIAVYPLDVFALTDLGAAQIHGGPTQLPSEALAVMVLLDAKATVGEIEQKASHIPPESLRDVLRSLVGNGLVRTASIAETDGLDFTAYFDTKKHGTFKPSAGTTASADREAERGAPELARTGYYVSIARHAVKARSPAAGARWSVFVVEDDPDVATLVARLLEGEGFDVEVAATRAEVVARLRTPPMPDVVILDVALPDANGFDILERLKTHPTLKAVPVIMLTAEAKRESVVRGLASGADGYITKPFKRAILLDGVRAVLGIGAA